MRPSSPPVLCLLCIVGAWRAARNWCACYLGEPRARASVMKQTLTKKRSETYLQQVNEVETWPLREKTKWEEDELVLGIKDASDGQEQSLSFTLHPRK